MKKILLILLPVLILIISGCSLPWQTPKQVSCTMEAKLCSDGSAVGRSGPNCEFAACPQGNNNPSITDFTSCATAGNPVMESYPRKCSANGQTFTEIVAAVGERCLQNADCQLPMDYAARSNCPYQAYCYNQKCAVGCPSWQEKTQTWDVKCQTDKDCNCATWNEQINYACACVDGQCVSIVTGLSTNPGEEFIPTACTQEAKLCPDGSAVGRTGPNCEFAPCPGDGNTLATDCQANNGTWLEQYQECEYVSQAWCTQVNGTFNECASACRHNPKAEFCTLQCVPVCSIK